MSLSDFFPADPARPDSAAPVPPAFTRREGVEITPIVNMGGIYIKRDDLAFADGVGACGSKVRQFDIMMRACPGKTLIVGCAAESAQQIYIADAVRRTGRKGIVVLPARNKRTAATEWALAHGVEIIEVRPGHRTVYMARARELAKEHGAVRWDRAGAVADTAAQVTAIPSEVQRVIIPVGSGLVAAGVLAGLAAAGLAHLPVLGQAVSTLAKMADIIMPAQKAVPGYALPRFEMLPPSSPYDKPELARLPDGTLLDPFYAAKAWQLCRPGDLFWVTGCRPLTAMPESIRGRI